MENSEILKERNKLFNNRKGARVGDYLLLPNGDYTRFTHDWGEKIQTGGGSSSYHIGSSGCLSYSGGLDSGVLKTDIIKTRFRKMGMVWHFDGGISGAGRGIDTQILFRVFELKDGADTSGLPQIARHKRQMLLEKADKMTLVNGNDQEYIRPIPEINIYSEEPINDGFLTNIEKKTGLKFLSVGMSTYKAQPMKAIQLVQFLTIHEMEVNYYDNSTFSNVLKVKFIQK